MSSAPRTRSDARRNRVSGVLGSLTLTSLTLLYLFVLVLITTLYQNAHPVREATARFINAWFFFAGPVPLPAGQSVFAILLVNLTAGTATRIPWRWDRAGLFVVHVGLIAMVGAALVGHYLSRESVLALAEGEADAFSYDLRRWDLVAIAPEAGTVTTDADALRFPLEALPDRINGRPLEMVKRLPDARLVRDGAASVESVGGARDLAPEDTRSPDEDRPVAGIVLRLGERTILLHGSDRRAFRVDDELSLRLLPRRYPLPATIRLDRFEATFYEGTRTPRSFRSEVTVLEPGVSRSATIAMNRPLRLGRHTLFQLGYNATAETASVSILQVVRNPLRWVPYAVSLLIAAGLILHAVTRMVQSRGASARSPGSEP
ncbi:MAG: cytochrome c biogenesis protein ResB [Spirochaetota bacterium]